MSYYHIKNTPEQLPKEKQATATVEELIEGNLKLVVHMANQYSSDPHMVQDLIQEGYTGLRIAAERFDPNKGASFGTYAAFWIKQKILRFIQYNRSVIRVPTHMQGNRAKGRKHTEEAASALSRVFSISNILEDHDFDIPDENMEEPGARMLNLEVNSIISSLIETSLDERERFILTERFNLEGKYDEVPTLDDLGVKFNLTKERIRQIEVKALKKLRFKLDLIWQQQKNSFIALMPLLLKVPQGA